MNTSRYHFYVGLNISGVCGGNEKREDVRKKILEKAKDIACLAFYGCHYCEGMDCRPVSMLAYPLVKFLLAKGWQNFKSFDRTGDIMVDCIRCCMAVAGCDGALTEEGVCPSHELIVWEILPFVEDALKKNFR